MTAVAVRPTAAGHSDPVTVWVHAGHGLFLYIHVPAQTVLWAGSRADLDTYRHDDDLRAAEECGCSALPDRYGPQVPWLRLSRGRVARADLYEYALALAIGDIDSASRHVHREERADA